MSGFFGIFRPQGGPVDLEAFEQMKTAMHREGFDGMETLVEDNIAIGHLMLRVSPESKYDKQPLKSSCGNYLLVGHFRLDYRDELGDKLGLTQDELEVTPDSQLAMLAYQKWREKCVHHLEGDWSFILIDRQFQSTILLKDKSGISSLYFHAQNGILVFSDEIAGIEACVSGDLLINMKQFSRLLLKDIRVENGFTLYENVLQIKPGEVVLITHECKIQNLIKQWEIENLSVNFKSIIDYRLEFESVLQLSVHSRSKNSHFNGIYLSSGYDSTTVMYYLAKELEFKALELVTFTSRPKFLEKIKNVNPTKLDESILVQQYVQQFPNVKSLIFDCPDYKFSEFIKSRDSYQIQNPIIPINQFWIEQIAKSARGNHVNSIFTGQLGNLSLSVLPFNYFLNLLFNFQLRTLYKDLKELKAKSAKSIRFIISEHLKTPLINLFRWVILRHFNLKSLNKFINFPWTYKLVNEYLQDSRKDEIFINGHTYIFNSKNFRKKLFDYYNLFISTAWWYVSKRNAIQVSDPTSDLRLINFSIAIPEKLFFLGGVPKFLFKELMKNKSQYSILLDNFKVTQTIDLGFRVDFDKNLKQTIELLDQENGTSLKMSSHFKSKLDEILREENFFNKFHMSITFLENLSLALFISKNHYICNKIKSKRWN